jgi:YegS/Rv2252/BmrU family lipid kinase
MADSIPVILNPAARSTAAARRLDALRALRPAPQLHLTRQPGDAERLARELVAAGHPLVVAAGGDGTVNEVLQGLCAAMADLPAAAPRPSLGVLPLGTMNVFALELNLPGGDLAACWDRISSGVTREIDLWRANDLHFIQLAGVGMDAEVIRQTTWEAKKRLGPLSYVLSALRVLRRRPPTLTVAVSGEPTRYGSLVLIGNGRHYGGPFPVFDRADPADGLLDVLVFHQVGPWELTQLARRIVTQGYSPSEDLEYFQASAFTIAPPPGEASAPMELDGELRGETPVQFSRAGSLRVAI